MLPALAFKYAREHGIALDETAAHADMIDRLHKEGDRVDDKMAFPGMFPATPLLGLASRQRTAFVRFSAGRRSPTVRI